MTNEIKYVQAEDKDFAGCNTHECDLGAEYELWIDGTRKDARCEYCAIELNWDKIPGALANELREQKFFNAKEKEWEHNTGADLNYPGINN